MTTQNASQELLNFLITQANSGSKDWFGFHQQRIAGIHIAYRIAENHANTMSPEDVADYAFKLNNAIFNKLIKAK
jgi:methyltransferase-like protein